MIWHSNTKEVIYLIWVTTSWFYETSVFIFIRCWIILLASMLEEGLVLGLTQEQLIVEVGISAKKIEFFVFIIRVVFIFRGWP